MMANKQIHELDPVPGLQADDQIVVSTAAGRLTRRATLARLPYAPPPAGSLERTIADRLADTVSVMDFGAEGDGVADDTAALLAALACGARRVLLPEGSYRVTAPLTVPAGVAVVGAGRDATTLALAHDGYGLSWSGAEHADGAVEGLRIDLPATAAAAAIRCRGASFRAHDLRIVGGGAAAWGIELDQCSGFSLTDILMAGDGADGFAGNGIRLRNSDGAATDYGDGTLARLRVRLASDNTKGLLFDGPTGNGNSVHNVLTAGVGISAPGRTGCRAVHIKNARRLTFVALDLASIGEGVVEEGTAADRTTMSRYIGVSARGVGTPYTDSNDTITGSVAGRSFVGCDGFPALPGFGDGDAMLPRGLWLPSATSGLPTVRASERGGRWRIDGGGAAHVELGPLPSGNGARLTCGVDGLTPPYDATLLLGDANIRSVSVEAPLHLPERGTVPPLATDQMIVCANGSGWNPAWERGLYTRAGGSWHRLLDTRTRGWVTVHERTGTSYTLQATDIGDRVEMVGNPSKTVAVPQMPTVPGTTKPPGSTDIVTGRKLWVEITVAQQGNGGITLQAQSGVTISGPTTTSGDGQSLVLRWTGTGTVRTRVAN